MLDWRGTYKGCLPNTQFASGACRRRKNEPQPCPGGMEMSDVPQDKPAGEPPATPQPAAVAPQPIPAPPRPKAAAPPATSSRDTLSLILPAICLVAVAVPGAIVGPPKPKPSVHAAAHPANPKATKYDM